MTDVGERLEPPIWFEPLRSPSWLVPGVRDGAPRIVCCAEPWQGTAVDTAGRDLRLGLPLYLSEALRFGTNARSVGLREPRASREVPEDADLIVSSAVAPDGGAAIRVRLIDPLGSVLGEIERDAHDEASLGEALGGLAHAVSAAAAPMGVRPVWNSLYTLPAGPALAAYIRGQHAFVRVLQGALPVSADSDSIIGRRADVQSVLEALGTLATSTHEPFPALLFFGALLAARDAGSPVVGGFRLPANARCTASTDPLDPVFAMTALVARVFGDLATSERRIEQLRAAEGGSRRRWLARVEAVT